MQKCSVVVITYNEENNIGRCLESVHDFADEIIVTDSLSTDNTKAICIQYGAKVIEQKFLGYIEQKNLALRQANYDYVLSLDADESVSEELKKSILDEKKKGFPADGYAMNRCNYFCGKWIKHGSWYPDKKIRLVNRNKASWGGVNPHDKIVMDKSLNTKTLQGDILHYTYNNMEEFLQQMNRFSTIHAKAMYENGVKPSYLKMIINPISAFLSGYFIKGGFREGFYGYVIARSIAYATMLKYVKLIQLHKDAAIQK